LEIKPALAQLSNHRKIDEDQAMNDLVAGFLKFRETGYHERTDLFHQLAATALSVPSISALTSKKSRTRTADTAP
jgi:hypothetical protein